MGKEQDTDNSDLSQVIEDLEDLDSHLKNGVSSQEYFDNFTAELTLEDVEPFSLRFLKSYLKPKRLFTEPRMSAQRLARDLVENFPIWQERTAVKTVDGHQKIVIAGTTIQDLHDVAKRKHQLYKQLTIVSKDKPEKFERHCKQAVFWFNVRKVTAKAVKLAEANE